MDHCRTMLWGIIVWLALSLPVLPAAGQATITVDTAADNTTAGDGACTLREAITNANANSDTTSGDCAAGVGATDGIVFGINGGGSVATIQPASQLPTITEGVTIDGTTQGCGGGPCIELDGTGAGALANGLRITGSNSTIRGLVINQFAQHGLQMSGVGATGNTIVGNYIGTDLGGTAALGNNMGVVIFFGATNNTIGGTAPGARNVISGNAIGVVFASSGTTDNVVQGNYIGTTATGSGALGNQTGVQILNDAANTTIGGTAPGAGNVISGNTFVGVMLGSGSGTTGNVVQGNFIGTDVTGTVDLGNSSDGVWIVDDATDNTIGGPTPGAGNVISGNRHGILISGASNVIQGNYIGTDVTGTVDLGNSVNGVHLTSPNNTIGGTAAGAGNVISGNNWYGVRIAGSSATGNVVQGNYIGTDVTGTAALGNSNHGVIVVSSNNTIGGTTSGAANTIAFNGKNGVAVSSSIGTGNATQRNSFFNNTLLGIDLGEDGSVTANDPGDGDTGPNNRQNFPTLITALVDGGNLLVTYNVDSDPANAAYPLTVEFFEADADSEEGQVFLGSDSYTTGAHPGTRQVNLGSASSLGIAPGDELVATATDDDGNTSEFSLAFTPGFTRYVATTGSDVGNDCTDALNPCETIAHAVGQADAGDTLDVASGAYKGTVVLIDKALHIRAQGVVAH